MGSENGRRPRLEPGRAERDVGGLLTSTLFTLLVLPAVYARFGRAGKMEA